MSISTTANGKHGMAWRLVVLALFWVIPTPAISAGEQTGKALHGRPNILLAIADDWSWPHAGAYGDKVVKTPNIDRAAQEGVLFNYAFAAGPACTVSRASILTGQAIHRLEEGGNHRGFLPKKFKVYPDLLEEVGYVVGYTRKGWGPGSVEAAERSRNPAGPEFKSFKQFLQTVAPEAPFCFWFGSNDPHRGYKAGSGVAAGMKLEDVQVPPFLPDTPTVRGDLLDYYFEVQRFDRDLGRMIELLKRSGKLENTLIVVTADQGMPFPRAKCTLYDGGTRVPLVVRWDAKITGGRTVDDMIGLPDLAATFLEAAGLEPPSQMTGRSFLNILLSDKSGRIDPGRDKIFSEVERGFGLPNGDKSYPIRTIRDHDFLYIRNLRPHLWPAGPSFVDMNGGPTKAEMIKRKNDPAIAPYYKLGFRKRPAEELFDMSKDPGQLNNVAGEPRYAKVKKRLRAELDRWMTETDDPRAKGETDLWDKYRYFGRAPSRKPR